MLKRDLRSVIEKLTALLDERRLDILARQHGIKRVKDVEAMVAWDHKAYYPGAHQLHLRITGDRDTGRLLGAQLLGHKTSEVSKRVDVFVAALYHSMRVEELNDLDLSYTPPLSSPWDPIQMGAQAWNKALGEDPARSLIRV